MFLMSVMLMVLIIMIRHDAARQSEMIPLVGVKLKKKKKNDLIYVYLYGKNGKTANMILTCEIFLLC